MARNPVFKILTVAVVFFAFSLTSAFAIDLNPTGVWLTKDKAEVTIKKCGQDYCGVITKASAPGLKDINNPDPKLQTRPIRGIRLLQATPVEGKREMPGKLYNPLDGKTYDGTLKMLNLNELRVSGCVLNIFCKRQTWTRIK